ncbi:WD40 repeat domain-containing protein [Streptomyces netropsis]|uniref:Outer membrane protein assembly factor BamB n=1 Tax=Streptomyces netropsis TaxID=55404 RepID=A0A7W7PH45_STRNE|nr:WD40 repeat domain-containing protein [Streptomyces netropsis]MBB4888395.1 outer membrane protein assembly factor BamB [Streptomyces netropsis]GGR29595.1 hypothetical protein GCM10010219_38030 [Streptomyces netropsis]
MELTNRLTRILHVPGAGLLASDTAGRVHLLDDELTPVRSSPVLPPSGPACGLPVYTMGVCDGWVVTKDKYGTITRLSLDTLDVSDVLDARTTAARDHLVEGEEPSPEISRGIAFWRGRVYVNNGYRQLVVIDLASFRVEQVLPSFTGPVAIESVCTDRPGVHVVGDRLGNLHFGSLEELSFPTVVRVDHGNIHRLLYDRLHDRFWATQDVGTGDSRYREHGLAIVDPRGRVRRELPFARNDVEAFAFSPDQSTAYVGGFDAVLHVLDNTTPTPRYRAAVKGFGHQVSDCAVGDDGSLFVLTQDGNVVKADPLDGRARARAPFRRQCVWDLQADPASPHVLYAATDDGVAVLELDRSSAHPLLRTVGRHVTGHGFTRRLRAMSHGWIAVTWDRKVLRADRDHTVLWTADMPAITHTIALSPDAGRALIATDSGGIELDTTTGEVIATLDVDGLPVWASTYLPTGERVLATRTGLVRAFGPDAPRPCWNLRLSLGEYVKRMWADEEHLYLTGSNGLKEVPLRTPYVGRRFVELLDNTVENGAVCGDTVCAVSYGGQIAAYDRRTGELTGLVEDLPGAAKAVTVMQTDDGRPLLVVGGRGGYLDLYRLDGGTAQGTLARVRRHFLPRQASSPPTTQPYLTGADSARPEARAGTGVRTDVPRTHVPRTEESRTVKGRP